MGRKESEQMAKTAAVIEPDAAVATADSAPDVLAWAEIMAWRDARYRRQAARKVQTEDQARAFIEEVGFCFLYPAPGTEMPSLWEAINGRSRAIPHHHHDAALSRSWEWKDSLPSRKWVWYGKLLRGKPMFVSFDLLPAFYALSENYGELDDYKQQFADGRMSVEAKAVYEALLDNGAPLSTNALRKKANMFGGGDIARRFERAMSELQADLKIVKCGTSDDNRWKYCYVYDLLLRWRPALAEEARVVSGRAARQRLLLAHLHNVAAAPLPALATLFGWDAPTLRATADELLATGRLREVRVPRVPAALQPKRRKLSNPDGDPWLALGSAHGLGR
jgi:hypothetical protein